MDTTRGRMMAMTMVGGDHFFLQRWVEYYGRQLGRENCYVLSHGGDPEHKKIAEGCNVIYLPFDATRNCFNQRRWQMLSRLTTGFTNFYNFVLVGDVDEIVCVDPAVSDSLPDYLTQYAVKTGPGVITPFAIEMVHNPALEPEPIVEGRNILDVRRIFRLNANYAKPCITRGKIDIAPGGHFANHPKLHLDPAFHRPRHDRGPPCDPPGAARNPEWCAGGGRAGKDRVGHGVGDVPGPVEGKASGRDGGLPRVPQGNGRGLAREEGGLFCPWRCAAQRGLQTA
jgi:hypothetical protein